MTPDARRILPPMRHVIHLFSALDATGPAPGDVPEWIHLLPAGTFRGVDGRGPYTLADPSAVITASMTAGKLPIDENHATDLAAPQGRPSPARGWIVELQARADGIWGRVEWTEVGRSLVAERAYRGISPAIYSEPNKDGRRVVQLLRASLVNEPNLRLATLHSRSNDMDFLTRARAALGLPADATEDAVLAALGTTTARLDAHAAAAATIARAAGLAATPEPAALATTVELHYRGTGQSEQDLRRLVVDLQAQVTTFQQASARTTAEAYVDGAIREGKPIKPLRDHYITRHMVDRASVETEIGALVSIHAGGVVIPPEPGATSKTLTAEEKRVCDLMGLDPVKFAETRGTLQKEVL